MTSSSGRAGIPPACPTILGIPNGFIVTHGNQDGDTAEVGCDADFRFHVSRNATRLELRCNATSGTFEPEPERCEREACHTSSIIARLSIIARPLSITARLVGRRPALPDPPAHPERRGDDRRHDVQHR